MCLYCLCHVHIQHSKTLDILDEFKSRLCPLRIALHKMHDGTRRHTQQMVTRTPLHIEGKCTDCCIISVTMLYRAL